jgi:hypothetical protein
MLNYGVFMTNSEFREFIKRCKETWLEDEDIQEIETQLINKKITSSIIIKYALTGKIGFFSVGNNDNNNFITHEVETCNHNSVFAGLLQAMIKKIYSMSIW